MKILTPLFLLIALTSFAQNGNTFQINSLPTEGVLLDKGWKFHTGDNPEWAKANFDDSVWESIDPTKDLINLPQIQNGKVGWMRLTVKIDSSILLRQMALNIQQVLASEIYLNGKQIAHYGTIDTVSTIAKYVIQDYLSFEKSRDIVVIAVKFAFQKGLPLNRFAGQPNLCFKTRVLPVDVWGNSTSRFTELTAYAFSKVSSISFEKL